MKSYKQFINESNTSFEWLNKQNNESYFELVDILQSKVFDDCNIISATDEDLDNLNDNDHRFWLYTNNGKLVYPKDIGDSNIDSIYVYNIPENEGVEFFNLLNNLSTIVEDIIGKKLYVGQESFVDDDGGEVYDYIIKLK
jgi:hypothetical protein